MNLIKQSIIFAYKVWPLTFIVALAISSVVIGPINKKADLDTGKIDCGNRETKALNVYLAKERSGAHNVSDEIIAHTICK